MRRRRESSYRAGLVAHYEAVSEVGIPIVLYTIPSRTALNVPPELLSEQSG